MLPRQMNDMTIPVAIFENKYDERPVRFDLSWQSLSQRLCQYDERQTKDGRAWSPVTYRPGTTRGKENVEQVHALVLDIDHSVLPVDLLGTFEYVAHTTFSHASDDPRWRVVLPLTHPVEGEDWPNFWLRANSYFGGCVDPQTKDRSRIFFLPSCMPGALHEAKQQHGLLLDPSSLPDVPQYEPQEPIGRRNGTIHTVTTDGLSAWAERFARAKLDELAHMQPNTGRNAMCNRVAFLLAGLVADGRHGLETSWVEQQLYDACRQNNLIFEDGERSVRATIASGTTAGLAKAWSPADRDDEWTPSPPLLVPVAPVSVPGRTVDTVTGVVTESPWQSLQELVDSVPEVEVQVIDGLLWAGRTHWIYSSPGVGKTIFMLAGLMHVAAGREFCGRPVTQGPVILIEEDSPLAIVGQYVGLIADIYGFDLATLPFWINRKTGFRLTDVASATAIMDALNDAPQQPVVVALDACEKLVPSDKFSSKELEPLTRTIQQLLERNIAVVIIDHTRKSSTTASTTPPEPLDLLYGGRQKSAISDVMMYFSGAIRSTARVTFTKFRGQAPGSFDISFDGASGFKVRTLRRELSETERNVMRALNNVPGAWITRDDICAQIQIAERTLDRILKGFVAEGFVERSESQRPARYRTGTDAPGLFG